MYDVWQVSYEFGAKDGEGWEEGGSERKSDRKRDEIRTGKWEVPNFVRMFVYINIEILTL